MIVNNTPSKTSTPLCPEECDVRIHHIARDTPRRKIGKRADASTSTSTRLKRRLRMISTDSVLLAQSLEASSRRS
jgi:hypothetical protein